MIDGMDAATWRAGFRRRPVMTYAEALLWVSLRDAAEMEDLFSGPVEWQAGCTTEIAGMVSVALALAGQPTSDVNAALHDALRNGEVTASGRKLVSAETNGERPQVVLFLSDDVSEIPVSAWRDHRMADVFTPAQGTLSTPAAVRPPRLVGRPIEHGWGDVTFYANDVFTTFPNPNEVAPLILASAANDSSAGAAKAIARDGPEADWSLAPGQSLDNWIRTPAVVDEMRRRMTSAAKEDGYRKLCEMLRACGVEKTPKQAGAIYRKAYPSR